MELEVIVSSSRSSSGDGDDDSVLAVNADLLLLNVKRNGLHTDIIISCPISD